MFLALPPPFHIRKTWTDCLNLILKSFWGERGLSASWAEAGGEARKSGVGKAILEWAGVVQCTQKSPNPDYFPQQLSFSGRAAKLGRLSGCHWNTSTVLIKKFNGSKSYSSKCGLWGSSPFFLFLFWPRCTACGIFVPQPGIKPGPPAVKARSLNHWTAREVLWGSSSEWMKTRQFRNTGLLAWGVIGEQGCKLGWEL